MFGFGCGNDRIYDNGGTDVIEFTSEIRADDLTIGKNGNDVTIVLSDGSRIMIEGGVGNTKIEKIHFTNGVDADIDLVALIPTLPISPIYGSGGNDTITVSNGANIIYGGAGNDKIHNSGSIVGDDIFYGEEGNDTLDGGYGNDRLDGGIGDDILIGWQGDDTYVFGFGYGNDTIRSESGGNDVIELKADVTAADIEIIKESNNDVKVILSDGSVLLIENGAKVGTSDLVETIRFANGVDADINLTELIPTLPVAPTYGTSGNDTLAGTANDDIIYGGAGNDYLDGNNGSDLLNGGDGDDTIYGRYGNDILVGGKGNDILDGGEDNDTYLFNKGDGHDTVVEWYGENDIISMQDTNYDQLWFSKVGNNLKISVTDSDDSITIKDWYSGGKHIVETIQAGDHTLSYTAVDQLVQAMAGFNPPQGSISEDAGLSAALDETLKQTWTVKAA